MKYLLITFLTSAVCYGQAALTGSASTSGACSPAVTGTGNTIQITCSNLDNAQKKILNRLPELLNVVLRNEADEISLTKGLLAESNKQFHEMLNQRTGGDSYLHATLMPPLNENPNFQLIALVEGSRPGVPGKYPIPETFIEVWKDNAIISRSPQQIFGLGQVHTLSILPSSNDRPYFSLALKAFTPYGPYFQFFMAKKYTDGKWYVHSVRLNDTLGIDVREEEHQTNFPADLKNMYIPEDMYIKNWIAQMPEETRKQIIQFNRSTGSTPFQGAVNETDTMRDKSR